MSKEPTQGPKPTATGERAMASTYHPEVTRTALNVLEDGGNKEATMAKRQESSLFDYGLDSEEVKA